VSVELFAIHPDRTHIRPNDVLSEILVHFDDDRPRHPGLRHHEVVTPDAGLHAARELENIAKLLPLDSLHIPALKNAAAW
jgi:hypothetical protein